MGNPAWRFKGNERKYLEEVLSTGFRAGADGAFTTRLESYFQRPIAPHIVSHLTLELLRYMRHYWQWGAALVMKF